MSQIKATRSPSLMWQPRRSNNFDVTQQDGAVILIFDKAWFKGKTHWVYIYIGPDLDSQVWVHMFWLISEQHMREYAGWECNSWHKSVSTTFTFLQINNVEHMFKSPDLMLESYILWFKFLMIFGESYYVIIVIVIPHVYIYIYIWWNSKSLTVNVSQVI